MSLATLSTELDANIVGNLHSDLRALDAMLRTSKYYRTVTERFLYKDIVISSDEVDVAKCLFLTVIDRYDLAFYIL
jgi:hypothetical protein